jgi:hypothetical protein
MRLSLRPRRVLPSWSFLSFPFLELIPHQFKNGHLRSVSDAIAALDDPAVAASAIRKLRRDFAEQFLGNLRCHQVRSRLAARLQSVALAQRDDLFRHRPRRFRARQRGGDPAVS